MIPYYSPNFGFADLLKTIFAGRAEPRLTELFQKLTGKEHILITSSCRSALYLAYKSLGKTGVVHVSPLTCQVAILPIIVAGNQLCFHDVKENDWTLEPVSVGTAFQDNAIAIQAIHLGGFPCAMQELRRIADQKGLILIEDCAQGYGSSYGGQPVGTLGDISCFTLTKNVFGLGGGILATNNKQYHERAKALQASFDSESWIKRFNRVMNGLISSGRDRPCNEYLYQRLAQVRQAYQKTRNRTDTLRKELKQPSSLYSASVAGRIFRIDQLNQIRQKKAKQIIQMLTPLGFKFQMNENSESAYTKLFCYHPGINSEEYIQSLNAAGLEAMHLEHRYGVFYQPPLPGLLKKYLASDQPRMSNYEALHDRLFSVPLLENLSAVQLNVMISLLMRNVF